MPALFTIDAFHFTARLRLAACFTRHRAKRWCKGINLRNIGRSLTGAPDCRSVFFRQLRCERTEETDRFATNPLCDSSISLTCAVLVGLNPTSSTTPTLEKEKGTLRRSV
jgi:hypothetical protein